MRIAIDLDGVCYEWDRTARYMLRTYRGCTGLDGESESWWSIKQIVKPDDWQWLWSEGVKHGLFRYGHMVKDTRWALDKLAQYHDLVIVTHRPESAVQDTIDWISLYFKEIPLSGLSILSNGEPKSNIHADLLIDDKPQNVWEWTNKDRSAILFAQPWNESSSLSFCPPDCEPKVDQGHIFRAQGWGDVLTVLTARGEMVA